MGLLGRLRGRANSVEPIIVVSGLPRSGTSMMMRMLTAGGVEALTDGERVADVDNPGGYYEMERVKKLAAGDVAWLAEARGKAVKVIAALLLELPDDYSYQVIFMRRRMEEILASQRRMLINRGEDPDTVPDHQMARMFTGHLRKVDRWLADRANVTHIDVDYNALVTDGGRKAATSIISFLDKPLDVDAMAAVVDPSLYRRRT